VVIYTAQQKQFDLFSLSALAEVYKLPKSKQQICVPIPMPFNQPKKISLRFGMFPQCSKHNAEYQCHCNHAQTDECEDVLLLVADPSLVGVFFYGWGDPGIDVGGRIAWRVFVLCVKG
jgi:hypothetical protein